MAAPLPTAPPTGGLPQFDLSWWPGEIVWTLVIFGLLFFLFSKVFVPRIGDTIANREDRISGDIGAARRLRDEAEAQAAEARAETAVARAQAQKLAQDAKAKAHAEVAARDAVEQAKVAEVIAKAELGIAATRERAMTHLAEIAADIAGAIVGKLTGEAASAAEVSAAVASKA